METSKFSTFSSKNMMQYLTSWQQGMLFIYNKIDDSTTADLDFPAAKVFI